jgi:hypothetical protein
MFKNGHVTIPPKAKGLPKAKKQKKETDVSDDPHVFDYIRVVSKIYND